MFQSPRSGRFESNEDEEEVALTYCKVMFQSPRSGRFESNTRQN